MDKEKFLKYKKDLVNSGKLSAMAGILILLSILLLIFVPIFKIEGEEPGQIFRFSLFSDFVLCFKMLLQGFTSWLLTPLLTVMGFIYLLLGIILYLVGIIKTISKLADIDGYAIIEYDKIIRSRDQREKTARKLSAFNNLIYGILLVFFSLILSKLIMKESDLIQFFELVDLEKFGAEVDYMVSYSAYMTGVTFAFYITIAVFIVAIIFIIIEKYKKEKIRIKIIKELYEVENQKKDFFA